MFVLIFMSTVSFANEQTSIVVRGTRQVFQDNGVYYVDIGGTHYRLDKRTNLLDQNTEYYYDDLVCDKFGHNWTKVYSGVDVTVFGVSTLPASVYDFVLGEASKDDITKLVECYIKDSKDEKRIYSKTYFCRYRIRYSIFLFSSFSLYQKSQ